MNEIAIIDYGVGNLRSIEKAFAATGVHAVVSGDEKVLLEARALVLPGVGAFRACMTELNSRGFDRLVVERATNGTPILGVCVGMQILFDQSDEFGRTPGLGLLRGSVQRFGEELVVPHVGWNQIDQRRDHPLLSGIEDHAFFYFVHSYFCRAEDSSVVIGETQYGTTYASVVAHKNIAGVQFHPEKSQRAGLQLLANFARMNS
jgi:glutamine amidotransferase